MKRFDLRTKYKAFSIVEISVALGIFIILSGSVSIFSIDAIAFVKEQNQVIDANVQANQMMNALLRYKNANWEDFIGLTDDGQKHFYVPAESTGWDPFDNFAIYREATGLEDIPTTVTDMTWDTTVTASANYNLEANNADISVTDRGHYLVMYGIHGESSGGTGNTAINSWIRLNNNSDLPYGRSQGFIMRNDGADEAYSQGATVVNMNPGDTVRVQSQRIDTNSATARRRANKAYVSLLKLDDTFDYFLARATTAQNIPTDLSFVTVLFDTTDEVDTGTYSRSGSNITLKKAGHYLITYNVGIEHSSNLRVNDESRILLNGLEVDATRVSTWTGSFNGITTGVLSWVGMVEATEPNQILNVQVRLQSITSPTTHNTVANESTISIIKLPDNADYIRIGETVGGQNMATTRTALTWNETVEEDSGSFDHDVSNTSRINIEQAGNYLFLHSVYAERPSGTEVSEEQFLEWRKNGTDLYSYGSSGQIHRGNMDVTPARVSGSSSAFIAHGLLDTDYLELTQINEATDASGTYQADRMGIQGINLDTLVSGSTTPDFFAIQNGTVTQKNVTSYFEVTSVYRDENEDIVESGGVLDPYSRKVTAVVTWTDIWGNPQSANVETYVNYWEIQRWRNSDEADFQEGTFYRTMATNTEGGEVTLELIVDLLPSWCNPALSSAYFDIAGSGIAKTVFGGNSYAYMGTGGNSSGDAYSKLQISGQTYEDLVVTTVGTWDGAKVNYIFNEGNYSYLTTDNNAREIMILNHTNPPPYSVVGWVDAPGSVDGTGLYAEGNYGYFGQGRTFRIFDISSKIGARSITGTVTVGSSSAIIYDIFIRGNYAYLATQNDANELYIIDISNKSSPSVINQVSVNDVNAREVYASEDGTRLFLITQNSPAQNEFFILDITTKTGTLPVISSLDVTTMNTTTMAVVEAAKVVVVAGEHITGQHNYRVIQYETETELTDCGGIELDDDIYDIIATTLYDVAREQDNYYTYAVTSDTAAEFQIVRGDEGELGGWGFGYYPSGTWETNLYDADSPLVDYKYFTWDEEQSASQGVTTDITIQVRGGTTIQALQAAAYVGPDGTINTVYTDPSYAEFPPGYDGMRYIQFFVTLTTSDPDHTPIFKKMDIYYEE